MVQKPFISIVMPVYNAHEYLHESVASVLNQSFCNLELILVNDCSRDNSGELCDKWSEIDARVKVIHLEQNCGAGEARNKGIGVAQGMYLTFIDADDTISLNLYQDVVNSIEKSDADIVVWGVVEEYYDEEGKIKFSNNLHLPECCCQDVESLRRHVIELEKKTLFGYQWNHMYRLDMILENNIRFETAVLYEDYFFNIGAIKSARKMNILDNCDYHYKKRMNDSITTRFIPEYFQLSTRRVKEMYDLYKDWNMCTTEVQNVLANIYLRYILSALMRNSDKRSNKTFRQNRDWVLNVAKSKMYVDLCEGAIINNVVLKVLQKLINVRWTRTCCIIGKLVCIMKQNKPMIFSKIKKNKV